ncbi:hypothetical protein BX265_0673 [Streptomyces sp. TLI_235]|nr:hypothetical protein [Streptomyces sp. TLI_235]PBC75977.1 hypothetical protein BX265_0673 [Streptomyces sp. TLI_235]
MSNPLTLSITPAQITVHPGGSADVIVTVVNSSTLVSHYEPLVVGLPSADRHRAEPAQLELNPQRSGTVTLRISVPAEGEPYAGRYVLGVVVRKVRDRTASRCEELTLTVPAQPALALSVHPEIVRGGPAAHYEVAVRNTGNTPLSVRLGLEDSENRVTAVFSPPVLTLSPGASADAELDVGAAAPWSGRELRRALRVTALGDRAKAEQQVAFLQRPRVNPAVLRVAGAAVGVLVMAAAVLGAALLVRGGRPQTPPTTPPAPTPSSSSPANPSPRGPRSRLVDFGRQRGDQLVAADHYTADGIALSTVLDQAPPECADATALALRTVTGLGTFLTSSRPNGVDLCNTVPVRIDFAAPARAVRLTFGGKGAKYTLTAQLDDGTTATVEAQSQPTGPAQLAYQAPSGRSIVSVVFGHSDPSPTAKDPTVIRQLAYTL